MKPHHGVMLVEGRRELWNKPELSAKIGGPLPATCFQNEV
jgi:hypothetical protein